MQDRIPLTWLFCWLWFTFCWAPLAAEEKPADEQRLLTRIRQVTFEGRRAGEGYFSPDGRRYVFQSEREEENPFFQIYVLDLETGDTDRLSPGWGKTTCAWFHPQQDKVLFASTHADPQARQKQIAELELRASGQQRRYSWDFDEHYEIYELELNDRQPKALTKARGYDAEGSWSPDGRLIVFASNRDAYARSLSAAEQQIFELDKSYFVDLYIMEADGSNVRRLTQTPGYDGGPFFSPGGDRIVWRRFSEDGATAEIFTMDLDGVDEKQLTRLGAMSWAPFYHPSGDYLVFATNLHGFSNFEVYLVDSQGNQEPVRVTHTERFDGLPVFSPDGKTLSWTSNRASGKQSQVFFATWDDAEARRLLKLEQSGRTRPEITEQDLQTHVEYLASGETEGRFTGSFGARLAREYAARYFDSLGLEPAGDKHTFFQEFQFTSGVQLGVGNELSRDSNDTPYRLDSDWRPLAFSSSGAVPLSPIVFAGYGIVAPADGEHPEYDSYAHLDVKDKWVLVLRFLPEEITPEHRQHLSRYRSLRYKALMARERGARGLLIASGPHSQVESQLIPLGFDASLASSGTAVISVTDALAAAWLENAGKNLAPLQKELDSGQPQMGVEIPGLLLKANIDISQQKSNAWNVLARLPSGSSTGAPAVMVGAHLDHLGRGNTNSLARDDERGQIHYGADDNASGSASLLEIAEYLVGLKKAGRLPMKRDLLLGLWSGEEIGLIGSSHFAESYRVDDDDSNLEGEIAAYLNLDMVGRLRKNLVLQGVGSSSVWSRQVERQNVPLGLSITTQNDSYLPTDATSFYMKRVPVLSAFTGVHSEYHTPRDRPDLINYEGMRDVARLMALITRSLLSEENNPDYLKMTQPQQGPGRAGLRAYLGTVPDYAQGDIEGVQLGGVISGGPAERAGVEAGDVIKGIAGRTIANIYDYTYAIEALKIGETVQIEVLRGDKRLTFEITPESRQ